MMMAMSFTYKIADLNTKKRVLYGSPSVEVSTLIQKKNRSFQKKTNLVALLFSVNFFLSKQKLKMDKRGIWEGVRE